MDKKEQILATALELFANDGYNATPTSRIAKKAGVSEGLIFSHYKNKKGLLNAIYEAAEKRLGEFLFPIIMESIPSEVIKKAIEMPYEIDESEYAFWKLQFVLKWDTEYYKPEKMKPLVDKLTWAFTELDYETPDLEATFLVQIIDTISVGILRDGKTKQLPYKDFLLKKYMI